MAAIIIIINTYADIYPYILLIVSGVEYTHLVLGTVYRYTWIPREFSSLSV